MPNRFLLHLLLLLGLILPCSALAQSVEEEARHDVDTLASRAMHGRGYDRDGHLKAAAYIRDRFRELGLDSLSDGYFQPFELKAFRFGGTPRLEVNGAALRLGHDYIPDEMSGSASFTDARVVDLGSGVFLPGTTIDEVSRRDVRGKVVVIDERVADSLMADTTLDHDLLSLYGRVQVATAFKARGVIVKVDRLTSGEYAPIGEIPVFKVRRDALPQEPRGASLAVENGMVEVTSQNVVARLRGTAVPDSAIIICAHYDHLGSIDDSTWFPGANDNASGVAMMLSLARHLSKHPLRYSVIFIAFSGEELGLLGSRWYVEHPLSDLKRVRFLLNLDMTASGKEGIMAVGGSDFPRELEMLRAAADSVGLKEVRKRPNAPNSDHFFFVNQGVRGFYIYPFTGLQPYHHIDDRPETLEWDVFLRLREVVRRFLEEL